MQSHAARSLYIVMIVMGAGVAYSQSPSKGAANVFPSKPLRIITSAPGGTSDFTSRLIAKQAGIHVD
ncbi:MAG: hypothetical protein V4637_01740 [Pseudomonadota bacterium]